MTMKEELAALKKKRDAGKITAFQFKKQSNKIREKYGKKGETSNVSKIFTYISTKSPMDALRDTGVLKASPKSVKGKAAAKAAKTKAENASSDRQLIAKARNEKAKQTPRAGTPTKRAAPKFNPSLLKMSTKDMEKQMLAKSDKVKNTKSKAKSSGKKLSKFEQAFADARKAGKKTFKFTNRAGNTTTYTTQRKDKKPLPKKGK